MTDKKIAVSIHDFFLLLFTFALILPLMSCTHKNNQQPVDNKPSAKASVKEPEISTKSKINPVDGAEMVYIPPGEFLMGADSDPDAKKNEKPSHKVYLDGFYIYKYEVTYRQFKKFLRETGYKPLGNWKRGDKPGREDHPVMYTTYPDVEEYCRWAKVKLPTEAQWEKAARGTDGRKFPWGEKWNPENCNNADLSGKQILSAMADIHNGRGTLPVGSVPGDMSPYGVMDMAGNINEWCRDWYKSGYYKKSPEKNPQGPEKGTERSTRGGAWSMKMQRCRATSRWSGSVESNLDDYGFRCVVEENP